MIRDFFFFLFCACHSLHCETAHNTRNTTRSIRYIKGQKLDWPKVQYAERMIRSWMHVVNELSRALSQIDCDTVFTCGNLYDVSLRDEKKKEILAAQYATRPEELVGTLKSQIGFTISQEIVNMILEEPLNVRMDEDDDEEYDDDLANSNDVEEKIDVIDSTDPQGDKIDIVEDRAVQEVKVNVLDSSIVTNVEEEEGVIIKDNQWTCEKCTLRNEIATLSCVLCGHSRSRIAGSGSNSNSTQSNVTNESTTKKRVSISEASNASLARSCMEPHWNVVFDEETDDALWECAEENMTCLKVAKKLGLPILSPLIAALNRLRFPQLTEKAKLRLGTRLEIPWLPISIDRRFRRLGWGRLITTNHALKMKCDGPKKFFWVQCDIETCGKWRRLPISRKTRVDSSNKWTCEMNVSDKVRKSCDAEEESYENEPLFAKQRYDQAEYLFDTAKKCIAHITGESSKNVTHWMKACLSQPSRDMPPLEAQIDRMLRIWMDGMNCADNFLSEFYSEACSRVGDDQ